MRNIVLQVSKVLLIFIYSFSFLFLMSFQWTYLHVGWFFLPPVQICCWIPLMYFSFSYSTFLPQIFCLVVFNNFHLPIFPIWWDINLILLFNSLDMIYFSSLNVFIIANLKSLHSKIKIWAYSGIVSIDCFLFCVWDILTYFFACLLIFFFFE